MTTPNPSLISKTPNILWGEFNITGVGGLMLRGEDYRLKTTTFQAFGVSGGIRTQAHGVRV